jgi:hypothetical protein
MLAFLFITLCTPFSPISTSVVHAQFAVVVAEEQPFTSSRLIDAVGWMVAKTAVNSLTQSVVNWINSGFQGSPAFATDLNRNLGNLGDAVAEDFIRGLDDVVYNNTGFSVRAPFQDQIARQLREEYYRTTSDVLGFDARYPYRDCYRGGGFSFDGWFCQSQNDANNVYGRYQLARNELFREVDKEAQNRLRELDWGNGFMSFRGQCNPDELGRADEAMADAEEAAADGFDDEARALEAESNARRQNARVSLGSRDRTVGCPVKTPGAVIEEALGISVTSPFRQLEIADNINEIVGALASQLVNQVLGGSGLSGVSRPSSGGGRSYLDRATDPTGSLSGGFAQNINQTRNSLVREEEGWGRIAEVALSASQACSSNPSLRREADEAYDLAEGLELQASDAIGELERIESERIRLTNAGGNDQAVAGLVRRFTDLLSRTGNIAGGENESQNRPGTLYSDMLDLIDECR